MIYTKEKLERMWLEGTINGEAIISTKDAIYEGEVFGITDEFLTMEFFNGVKDEMREVDIPLTKIEKATFN